VVVPAADAAADRHAHHDRRRILAARAVTKLRQLVHDLIEGRIDVVAELDLGDRTHPVQRHPDCGADDPRLRQGRIDAAISAELFLQTAGGPKDAAETPDVLAQHDDARIAAHLDLQCVVHGLAEVHLRHGRLSWAGGLPYSAAAGKSRFPRPFWAAGRCRVRPG
jgi:hypothetical protein